MSLRRYSMAAAITATGNASDTFVVQRAGTIKQICFHFTFDSITDGASLKAQISRAAVADFGTSANVGAPLTQALAKLFVFGNFVTSGLSQVQGNFIVECNDRITVGENLYINQIVAGTLACSLDVLLVVEESGS